MLFSENYDKMFWLMLTGDEKNRDNLVNFIRVIPLEIFEYIRNEILNNTYNSKRIRYEINGYIYEIHVDLVDGLNIKMWRWKGYSIQEKFELLLNPLTFKQIEKINIFEKIHIGKFYCNIVNMNVVNVSSNSKFIYASDECYLMKMPLGYLLQVSDNFESRFKLVNYNRDFPGELNAHDFTECVKVERLVRTKNRKK